MLKKKVFFWKGSPEKLPTTSVSRITHPEIYIYIYIYIYTYEGWNFNSGNYLFTTDTK